jgi:hypothetical protein
MVNKVKVRRVSFVDSVTVDCLVVNAENALSDLDAAIALLQEWMRFRDLDYYRICSPDPNGSRRIFFYEVSELSGVYWARDRGEKPVDVCDPIVPRSADWDNRLSRVHTLASQVDAQLVFPFTREKARIGEAVAVEKSFK